MGKFDKVLLVSDYDGTLASSDGTISRENKEAIRYFIKEGGFFTVCTGRSKQGFHAFDPSLMNVPVIVANGGMLYDYAADKVLDTFGISNNHISILERISERFPYICAEMYSDKNNTFTWNICDESREHLENQNIKYTNISDFCEAEFPIVKLMLYVGRKNTASVQRYLSGMDLLNMKYIPSDGNFIELLNKNTDKGKAMLHLAEHYEVQHSAVFAVGDGSNDVDMLRAASVGFVPENGEQVAKNAGTVIVKNNDEGAVADVIGKLEELCC